MEGLISSWAYEQNKKNVLIQTMIVFIEICFEVKKSELGNI